MSSSYKRKCDNWLSTFMDWTMPRSEAPSSILFWCGLFTLAVGLRRHVKISKRYLGSWEVYPSIYTLFVGPPGLIKKSTTIGYADTLLDQLAKIPETRIPDSLTVPVLLEKLEASHDSSCYVIASEFGVMMEKAGIGLYIVLTDLFDGKKRIDEATISRGYKFINSPTVSLLGATTPEWIGGNMPQSVLRGGFGSRIIPIFENEPRQREIFYDHLEQKDFDILERRLVDDLQHIAENINGEFEIDSEAKEFVRAWYKGDAQKQYADSKMSGFVNRLPAHLFKIAMLMQVAETDDLTLRKPIFEKALAVLNLVAKNVQGTYRAVGKNESILDLDEITKFITNEKRATLRQIAKAFESVGLPAHIEELVMALVQLGEVKMEFEADVTYFSMV